ncbi:hypothetical protein CEP54_016077 [Fusarium duplospermum]|uniref:Glycerate dehydrogenase n=1 Tax=Fusarium duplospermum TaxID=1325734 RepID=A0A428NII5_9HYPO|nr:hypothetical protein CEP54_016077 [Fusarium duplospermum]
MSQPSTATETPHHIVFLEAANAPLPKFAFPHTYRRHPSTQPHEIPERVKDATIVILEGFAPITPEHLEHAPKLQCVAITATGIDWLDRQAFAERYRGRQLKIVEVHNAITAPERYWVKEGSLTPRWRQGAPLSCQQEVLGIIGYGSLGRKVESLARGVGIGNILIAERKGESTVCDGRVHFEHLLKTATTIVVCCPKQPGTLGLISAPVFEMMKPEALLLNVSRGGIVCESALATVLKQGTIFGAATDVFETEPGGIGTTPLIPDVANEEETVPNLTMTSHITWFSQKTIENPDCMLRLGIEGFVKETLQKEASRATLIVHKEEILK